jgi:hypothetical protein
VSVEVAVLVDVGVFVEVDGAVTVRVAVEV